MIPLNKYILGETKSLDLKTTSIKTTKLKHKRLDLNELEMIYLTDALVRNSISASIQLFDCDYEIKANSTIREKAQDFLNFINFSQLKRDIAKNCFIYGDSWIELVERNNKLVGVVNLNSKTIDYQKTADGLIELDRYGKPKGYMQIIELDQLLDPLIQKKVKAIGAIQGIPLRPDQIARFCFDSVGEGWYGLGLIEPIYSVTLGKNEAEAGLAHVINKVGFPIVINSVGDSDHEPTADMIDKGAELIQDLNYKTEISIPHYMKLDTLKITRIEKLREYLQYFIEQQITGIGIPGPIATGSGQDTNRSTLVTQVKIFMKINDARRKIFADQFNNQVFTRLAKSNNWSQTPEIVPVLSDLDSILESIDKDVKTDKKGEIG
jgi:hypothetical protein